MKQTRPFPKARVTRKAEISIKNGHPWVYEDEITSTEGELPNGCIVDVYSPKDSWLGAGLLSLHSKIRIRILSSNANETFSGQFWIRRVGYALDLRRSVMGEYYPSCCRLIFGEADGLPGLTVDCFGDLLVSEVLSYGIDMRKDQIYRALKERLSLDGVNIRGIWERNTSSLREKEGLETFSGWYAGDLFPEDCGSALTEITENGIRYAVDVENGQKTGFFLDQKYNRLRIQQLARGRRVLDCFTHTGSFAMNAAAGGAEKVTAVDISSFAIESARQNLVLNGLEGRVETVCADVFELLNEKLRDRSDRYDMIILDPPAFTKSRSTVDSASRGYKQINMAAMRLLPRGGILATCSCSHFMTESLFEKMLASAARDAGVSVKILEKRQQAPDHPVLLGVDETSYLKFYILQIV
ncbi:MAG: class I SAM-dependent rRNA methyltransferase [Eubacteriaceae bacterium]|nr:class I SAM-dependent rRNA methyltransferase [Eubacteriaceae bacterium]